MIANVFRAYLTTKLEAGGSETTISIDRVTTLTGETITTSDFADFSRGVIAVNPDGDGISSYPEYISFTAVSGLTLTGAVRGLSAKSNSVVAANKRFHPDGTPVILTFGSHTIQDILDYIDAQIGALTLGANTVSTGTAGEDLTAGQLAYLKNDSKWWKTDADTAATLYGVILGIVQSTTLANATITSGVLQKGLDTNQTGLVAGTEYFASNTAGAIGTSAGTNSKKVGVARSTTNLYFDPNYGDLPNGQQKLFLNAVTGMISMFGSATPPTGFLNCDGSAVSRTTYADLFAVLSTTYGVGDGSTTFNVPNLSGRFPLGYAGTAPTKVFTFSSRSSNTITITGADNHAHNELQTGQAVLYDTTSGVITGLTDNTTYYLIRIAYNQFQLATSVANANAGTAITLSSDGSGTQTFTITYTARPMGQTGGEEKHALITAELPSHNHGVNWQVSSSGVQSAWTEPAADASATRSTTDNTGGDTPHNNMPPFVTVNFIIKT